MKTILRYEVWASKNGEIRNWCRVTNGIFFEALGKQRALNRAEIEAETSMRVCVEEYDHNRDIYLRTIVEYPSK